MRNDLVDSSGLTLYYTPILRPHDLRTLVTGQWDIQIPPRYSDWMVTSDCTASRTKDLIKNDIYITSAYNYMQYLGNTPLWHATFRSDSLLKIFGLGVWVGGLDAWVDRFGA